MSESNYYALIMAGGRGTRFWPRSRRRLPKQVLNVVGGHTLMEYTVERLTPLVPQERMWVLTNDYVRDEIVRQAPGIPKRQIIAEPAQRNTAPCNGLAAHILHSMDPDAVIGVFAADHAIGNPAQFRQFAAAAYAAAERGSLVVLGIQPRWAETGYGYIEFPPGTKPGAMEAIPVRAFREKPAKEVAEQFVAAGNFYWNSGVFFWRADAFLSALRTHLPKTATLLAALPRFSSRAFGAKLREAYPLCENISVDYAVMEKAGNVVGFAAGADLEWNDVGSWNAVYELTEKDGQGNAARSELVAKDSRGNYVDAAGKLVALLGVRDLVVVDTPDALLIADRSRAQEVGEIVKELERQKREELL